MHIQKLRLQVFDGKKKNLLTWLCWVHIVAYQSCVGTEGLPPFAGPCSAVPSHHLHKVRVWPILTLLGSGVFDTSSLWH